MGDMTQRAFAGSLEAPQSAKEIAAFNAGLDAAMKAVANQAVDIYSHPNGYAHNAVIFNCVYVITTLKVQP